MERVLKSVEWCVYGGERFGRSTNALHLRLSRTVPGEYEIHTLPIYLKKNWEKT